MKRFFAAAALALASCRMSSSPGDMSSMKSEIRRKFPTVTQLSTADLAAWQADSKRPAPVLLDARTPAEFAVSRLAGAKNVTTVEEASSTPKDAPIVVYCSVGYRSSALAEKLTKAGFTNVKNLEGSIFEWANEGREVVNDRGKADKVHPYDEKWGQMLKPELRADAPPVK